MSHDMTDLMSCLERLGFRLGPESIRALLQDGIARRTDPVQLLHTLATVEARERDACNLQRRTTMARLGVSVQAPETGVDKVSEV
jgi:hypothetical protein